jgi:hypothetical protein
MRKRKSKNAAEAICSACASTKAGLKLTADACNLAQKGLTKTPLLQKAKAKKLSATEFKQFQSMMLKLKNELSSILTRSEKISEDVLQSVWDILSLHAGKLESFQSLRDIVPLLERYEKLFQGITKMPQYAALIAYFISNVTTVSPLIQKKTLKPDDLNTIIEFVTTLINYGIQLLDKINSDFGTIDVKAA